MLTVPKLSVGIITPHTNQQKKINDAISKDPNRDYYLNDLKLKVMTFDTCQGEERDIIYYSMVATAEDDRLQYIFSKDLALRSDEDEEDSLRKQRLNVGLSRSKESMRFVISKPIEEFRGAIGEALLHYQQVIANAKLEKNVTEVDSNSGMEPKILNWFYQTSFWKDNKDRIELNPQFEIGKYLKQLDPTYHHPAYKVDFHISYTDPAGKPFQIVLEYDGFQEHQLSRPIDGSSENYESYYSAEDIYRQKVLESYGYKFLRINKFNLGINPIETLNTRIAALMTGAKPNQYLSGLKATARDLLNGDARECPSCSEILRIANFKDPKLTSGIGRICMNCKMANTKEPAESSIHRLKPCPMCGSKMKLRNGYRGKFYGCVRFPGCRGTRNRGDVISSSAELAGAQAQG
jgi:very-short-patch-repair endonuclease